MSDFNFNTTPGIIFGKGVSTSSSDKIIDKLGDNIFLITDADLIKIGLNKSIINELSKSSSVEVFDDVESDPSKKTLIKALDRAKTFKPTGILGFGGGSSMDIAKLVSLLIGTEQSIENIWGVGNAKGPRLPLVLIPTTAGTGSEVTPISIITLEGDQKKGVSSPIILPDLAVLDPELTLNLPRDITAATGIDAMVHAIESYTSINKNNNPISKLLAIESLKLLGTSIETAVFDGHNIEARSNMLLGSMMAGQAFANSPVSAVHALAYPIGGIFHIPHGLSNSLILPHVLKFNSINPKACEQYAFLAPLIFKDINLKTNNQIICNEFIERLENLSSLLNIPSKLRDIDIPKEACAKMAKESMKQTRLLVNNPREVTEEDAFNIYNAAW
ncbi:MAG: iron-containing alcohol dehydrogenase [Proteobacteria bacterium]|nr:iron-containing alcohol dehydrogenase [Alphaproteobacteria bacterium]MDA1181811.1 iron-containing alcohol dehydrogenase [Pseudomonadota bacterium]